MDDKIQEILESVGLANKGYKLPHELSGGEQQRVSIARALVNDPAVIFADEPSGNLDSSNAITLHNLFFDLRQKLNQTFVIATHNEELATNSDRKLTMKDGKIVI